MLDNGAWEKYMTGLYYALFADKNPPGKNHTFHRVATPDGVLLAQKGLRGWLPVLSRGVMAQFPLSEHVLGVHGDESGFAHNILPPGYPIGRKTYPPEYFGTIIYSVFVYLLERSGIKLADLLICANKRCERPFVPLRKPAKNKRAYCSTHCSHLVAVWDYRDRARKDAGKHKALKEKEKRRSKQRYRKKILKK
jgi:hypothetical protein